MIREPWPAPTDRRYRNDAVKTRRPKGELQEPRAPEVVDGPQDGKDVPDARPAPKEAPKAPRDGGPVLW